MRSDYFLIFSAPIPIRLSLLHSVPICSSESPFRLIFILLCSFRDGSKTEKIVELHLIETNFSRCLAFESIKTLQRADKPLWVLNTGRPTPGDFNQLWRLLCAAGMVEAEPNDISIISSCSGISPSTTSLSSTIITANTTIEPSCLLASLVEHSRSFSPLTCFSLTRARVQFY